MSDGSYVYHSDCNTIQTCTLDWVGRSVSDAHNPRHLAMKRWQTVKVSHWLSINQHLSWTITEKRETLCSSFMAKHYGGLVFGQSWERRSYGTDDQRDECKRENIGNNLEEKEYLWSPISVLLFFSVTEHIKWEEGRVENYLYSELHIFSKAPSLPVSFSSTYTWVCFDVKLYISIYLVENRLYLYM